MKKYQADHVAKEVAEATGRAAHVYRVADSGECVVVLAGSDADCVSTGLELDLLTVLEPGMERVAEYHGRDSAVMQLYRSKAGWHLSETGAKWHRELFGTKERTLQDALEYVQDIADHAPECYELFWLLGEGRGVEVRDAG